MVTFTRFAKYACCKPRLQFHGMEHAASAFFLLNVLLFLVFTAFTVTRYILYPWMLWRMLSYPAQCAPETDMPGCSSLSVAAPFASSGLHPHLMLCTAAWCHCRALSWKRKRERIS